jgi:hypothetical protein
VTGQSARAIAHVKVAAVRDDPSGRLALMRNQYRVPRNVDRGYLFRSARLRPPPVRRLRGPCDGFGWPGSLSSPTVAAWLEFIRHPAAASWYRAHNMSVVVRAYLEHQHLSAGEGRIERFFINLVLVRVLYTHALVAAPRMALGWPAPAGRLLGDPQLGMTGIFLSLSRVLPDQYPFGDDITPYAQAEHGLGHFLDVGVIQPRVERLYAWSASELDTPGLRHLLFDETPCYAWPSADRQPRNPTPSRLARLARKALPVKSTSR